MSRARLDFYREILSGDNLARARALTNVRIKLINTREPAFEIGLRFFTADHQTSRELPRANQHISAASVAATEARAFPHRF